MAHRTDTAYSRSQAGHFIERPTDTKLFKATKLDNVKPRIGDRVILAEKQADFGMPFNARDRINDDAFHASINLQAGV